jgi:predicted RNA binding protein YcfA (HicA-like mRNA interferase family)
MTRLALYPGDRVVRATEAGWRFSRQKGSHVILERTGYDVTLSIPVHQGKM